MLGDRWQLIDGMRFRVRTGIPWRDMPEQYGPWGRAYDLFPPLAAQRRLVVDKSCRSCNR